jgi:hopene-associated glycosyltransferase HpnB
MTIVAAVALAAWIYLVVFHGRFWLAAPASSPAVARTSPSAPRVAVVIPARNEADVVVAAVTSLLSQDHSGLLHIFLVDDASTDGTADVARRAAADLGRSGSLTVIPSAALPTGWTGKLWAVAQGVARARDFQPGFLLLTDADVAQAPDALSSLVALAESGPHDLVSYMVRLHCATAAERLLIPAFVYFFFLLYPPRRVRDRRSRVAGAAGGCMLVRPEALERAGGIEAIRAEIIDDCALAAAIKRSGGAVWLGLAPASHSLRPYDTFAAIEHMIARTAFDQLRHSALLLLGCVAGLLLTFVAPVALLFSGHALPVALAASAWALMTISYFPMVRFYRRNAFWALTLPLAAVFYLGATAHSAINYWRGRGGQWKGRAQDVRARTQ